MKGIARFSHEEAVSDSRGVVYFTEDAGNNSGFYRYTPNNRHNPGAGGRLEMLAISSVYPSGGALAVISHASSPFAPGRLSTMTCWCSESVKRCASTRATMSELPPAPYGRTMRIGRTG